MIHLSYKPGTLDVCGHADYAKEGQDVVCAGASTLLFTWLDLMESRNEPIKLIHYDPDQKGHIRVSIGKISATGKAYLNYYLAGMMLLKSNFPDHLLIQIEALDN